MAVLQYVKQQSQYLANTDRTWFFLSCEWRSPNSSAWFNRNEHFPLSPWASFRVIFYWRDLWSLSGNHVPGSCFGTGTLISVCVCAPGSAEFMRGGGEQERGTATNLFQRWLHDMHSSDGPCRKWKRTSGWCMGNRQTQLGTNNMFLLIFLQLLWFFKNLFKGHSLSVTDISWPVVLSASQSVKTSSVALQDLSKVFENNQLFLSGLGDYKCKET